MNTKTVQYKRTLRSSVGAGVSALFNGDGRRFFILNHKDNSKYHKAGESQKIIIDQIELGRDSNCQVRFDDESFKTVSRRHAAIVKDGERWKLVHLSTTNSTLVNGVSVTTEKYLENGDEIQLSIGGPRMGFIVPVGKQSLVSSIKMTERLELFRKQALRPYKTALASMAIVLVLLSCTAAYFMKGQHDTIIKQDKQIAELVNNDTIQKGIIEDLNNKVIEAGKTNKVLIGRINNLISEKNVAQKIESVESSLYAILTDVYVSMGNETKLVARSQGTGFLLTDKRFITARHCIEPWMFKQDLQFYYALAHSSNGEIKIYAEIMAINHKGETIKLSSNDFKIDRTYDTPIDVPAVLGGHEVVLKGSYAFGSTASLGNDWAYANTSNKGSIVEGKELSAKLKKGTEVHLLGFPQSLGIADGEKVVEPIYNKLTISRDNLNDARCIMVSQGIDHGNSGGPVFVVDKGELKVIGIVSRGDGQSEFYNHLIPMDNLK